MIKWIQSKSLSLRLLSGGLSALLLMAGGAASGLAEEADFEQASRLVEEGEILPLQQILERIEIAEGAHLLEVELEVKGESLTYEFEFIMPDGHIEEHFLDARTGEVIAVEYGESHDDDYETPAPGEGEED